MTEALDAEVQTMCNLSQAVAERAFAEGFAEGFAESFAETRLSCIRNLMANTGWPLEKVMELMGVPEPDRPKYASLLQKQ